MCVVSGDRLFVFAFAAAYAEKRSASRFPSFCVYEGGQDNFERRALGSAAKGEAIKREKTAGEEGGKRKYQKRQQKEKRAVKKGQKGEDGRKKGR